MPSRGPSLLSKVLCQMKDDGPSVNRGVLDHVSTCSEWPASVYQVGKDADGYLFL
jgi:hypothetical protein